MDTVQTTVQTWDKQGTLLETRVDTVQLAPEEGQRYAALAEYKTAAMVVTAAKNNTQIQAAMKGYVRATTKVLQLLDSRITDE